MVTRTAEQDDIVAALRAARDVVLARWIAAVQALPIHQQDPRRAVTDHMPRLLDAVLHALSDDGGARDYGQEAAFAHAVVRVDQGLDSGDVVAEFRLLRVEVQRILAAQAHVGVQALLAVAALAHDHLDRLVAISVRAFDVQARSRIEHLASVAAARASTLSAVIGAMPDGIFVCDTEQHLVLINPSAVALLGISAQQAPEAAAAPLLRALRTPDGQHLATDAQPLARAVRGEVCMNEDYLIMREDAHECLLRVSFAPIRGARGAITGGVCVARDVTVLRRLERERDEFVSRTSHELKTPLTSATGLLQLARRRLARQQEDPLGLGPMLETAQKQVDRLAVLVDDLRSVSQLRTGRLRLHPVDLDLRTVVEDGRRSMQATTSQHVLHVQQPEDPLMLHGDATRLAQVLDNLLSNAIKYSPNGGDIQIRSAREDGVAVVEIEDHGIGVPAPDRATLFEPFQRASNADQAAVGMGLGLYISRELARQHGGDLQLARTSPEGSTFRLSLPLLDEPTEGTRGAP